MKKKYIQQKYAKCFDVICLKTKINYTYQSSESWHTDEQSYFLLQRRYSTTQTVGKLQVLAKTCSLTSQLTGQTLLINGVQSGFPQRFFKTKKKVFVKAPSLTNLNRGCVEILDY